MNKKFYDGIFMNQDDLRHNGIYNPIKIDYYKTEEISKDKNIVKYGIEVVKTEYQDNNTNVEVNKMYEISDNEEKIDEILKMFKENEVTPINADEIVSDFFCKF